MCDPCIPHLDPCIPPPNTHQAFILGQILSRLMLCAVLMILRQYQDQLSAISLLNLCSALFPAHRWRIVSTFSKAKSQRIDFFYRIFLPAGSLSNSTSSNSAYLRTEENALSDKITRSLIKEKCFQHLTMSLSFMQRQLRIYG